MERESLALGEAEKGEVGTCDSLGDTEGLNYEA
jgi:hypothetical protein